MDGGSETALADWYHQLATFVSCPRHPVPHPEIQKKLQAKHPSLLGRSWKTRGFACFFIFFLRLLLAADASFSALMSLVPEVPIRFFLVDILLLCMSS